MVQTLYDLASEQTKFLSLAGILLKFGYRAMLARILMLSAVIIDLNTPPNSIWPGKVVAADFFDEQWRMKP